MKKRISWSEAETKWLLSIYPTTPNAEIARRCGRSVSSVKQKAQRLQIKKEIRVGGFKPGIPGWNKGKRFRAGGRSLDTQFQVGSIPHNAKPEGVHLRSEHGKPMYAIKLPGARKLKWMHRYLWEKHHGPIPRGHVVTFRNGDTTDYRLENLECIGRGELMRRNNAKIEDRVMISKKAARTRTGKTITDQILMCQY